MILTGLSIYLTLLVQIYFYLSLLGRENVPKVGEKNEFLTQHWKMSYFVEGCCNYFFSLEDTVSIQVVYEAKIKRIRKKMGHMNFPRRKWKK